MEQYISKSAVVAEIERRIKECDKLANAAADNNLSNTLQAEEIWDTVIDWLNAHHFDHRHLIEKGLALEAPEGMYNIN